MNTDVLAWVKSQWLNEIEFPIMITDVDEFCWFLLVFLLVLVGWLLLFVGFLFSFSFPFFFCSRSIFILKL